MFWKIPQRIFSNFLKQCSQFVLLLFEITLLRCVYHPHAFFCLLSQIDITMYLVMFQRDSCHRLELLFWSFIATTDRLTFSAAARARFRHKEAVASWVDFLGTDWHKKAIGQGDTAASQLFATFWLSIYSLGKAALFWHSENLARVLLKASYQTKQPAGSQCSVLNHKFWHLPHNLVQPLGYFPLWSKICSRSCELFAFCHLLSQFPSPISDAIFGPWLVHWPKPSCLGALKSVRHNIAFRISAVVTRNFCDDRCWQLHCVGWIYRPRGRYFRSSEVLQCHRTFLTLLLSAARPTLFCQLVWKCTNLRRLHARVLTVYS